MPDCEAFLDDYLGVVRAEGLRSNAPLAGFRCARCGCTVGADHVPGSADCGEARRERDISQADD